jgi:hypothetical protein
VLENDNKPNFPSDFLLRDMQNDLLGPEGTMGLFSYQGKPKPAFQAFLNATEKAHSTQR